MVLVYHDRDIAAELDEAENCLAPATFLKNQFTAVNQLVVEAHEVVHIQAYSADGLFSFIPAWGLCQL